MPRMRFLVTRKNDGHIVLQEQLTASKTEEGIRLEFDSFPNLKILLHDQDIVMVEPDQNPEIKEVPSDVEYPPKEYPEED